MITVVVYKKKKKWLPKAVALLEYVTVLEYVRGSTSLWRWASRAHICSSHTQ